MSLSFGSAPKVSSGDNCDEATKAAASEATEAAPATPARPTIAVSLMVLFCPAFQDAPCPPAIIGLGFLLTLAWSGTLLLGAP